ncbi:MAG: VCBS domain-containing protein, partial [Amphritea sp.]|nr:VCBS domain-containing protein [Amphritea sp.]
MADQENTSPESLREAASADLFNQEAAAHINPNRSEAEEIFGHNVLSPEELFKQNIQGRIDDDLDDWVLSELQSDGFNFELNHDLLSSLTAQGSLPAGTQIATLSIPVEGADFSFILDDGQFIINGDALFLKSELTAQLGELYSLNVNAVSNTSEFAIDVPLTVNFDGLAELVNEINADIVNVAPDDISLSQMSIDETLQPGDVVATLTATDFDNVDGFQFELTGEGADLFEIVGNELVVKVGASFDYEAQSSLPVEITVTDAGGKSFTETVSIDVNDINEAPVLSSASFQVDEGDSIVNGELEAVDQDFSEQLSFVIADGFSLPPGFELTVDGDYSFDPDNVAYQHLGVGDSQVLTIPVKVVDSGGLESSAEIRISLVGTNDAPVADTDVIVVTDEGASSISGQLTASDVDGDSVSFSADSLPAGFTLESDGSYRFDPADPAYDGMAIGDSQTLSIPVTVTDEHGATDSQQIQITVSGTNDEPVAGIDIMAHVLEGDSAISGQLTASDVDGDSVNFSADSLPAGFTLESDGSYSFDPADSAYDGMGLGDSQTLTIPVTVTDENGATDSQQIQVTVTGTNDAPVAGADVTANVAEGDSATSGQLTASDVDGDSVSFSADSLPAGFTLESDGSYNFDPADAAYDGMGVGDSQTLTIPVTVTDENGATDSQQIQVTVTGTN